MRLITASRRRAVSCSLYCAVLFSGDVMKLAHYVLATQPEFTRILGTFYAVWSSAELCVSWAIGHFLRINYEETHVLTAGMEFGRKAILLRALVKRSDHKHKDSILGALNKIHNDSKRNAFAHSFISSTLTTVTFVERSGAGGYKATAHTFTLPEFAAHVNALIEHSAALSNALDFQSVESQKFGDAALSANRS